jgi:hypothetical protein
MKKLFTFIFLLVSIGAFAQAYNNEWIDFSKTYYKFKIATNGLYRIPQSVISNAGLGSVLAQNFQLFRNGKEVPIYVTGSNPGAPLGSADYIEFWGQRNDGAPDNPLYRSPSYQHTQYYSLETDTAVYFLVENTSGNAFHYNDVANNVTGSTLTPETSFQYMAGSYFKSVYGYPNPGFAQVVGEYIYSSSYDIGEFWATDAIGPGGPFSDTKNNLFVYSGAGAPDASIKFGMAGTADNARTVQVAVNGTQVDNESVISFADLLTTKTVPLGLIAGNSATISFANNSSNSTDRMVVSFYELTYARQWNFGGQTNFAFQLPARALGYLLNIAGFAISGGIQPILYDLTDGSRYTGLVNGGTVSFALPGLSSTHSYILVNEDNSTVRAVTSLTPKRFVDFSQSANQGNYIIISNPLLYTGSNGNNPVTDYKNYRSSVPGGSFAANVYDINELVDQFAFGIRKHPISIQNFLRYAKAKFAAKPQYVLLVGHGVVYPDYYYYSEIAHDPQADYLNLVPTFGNPGSDNKLTAANGVDAVPGIPVGRISVSSGPELEIYLDKVKDYEQVQTTSPNTVDGRLWMKSVVQLTGVSEPYLGTILCNYMASYQQIISDTLYGASVYTVCDGNASQVSQIPANAISNLFSNGFSVFNYFGHSSNTTLGYNLDEPQNYNNYKKYPVFYVNGCDAGDIFIYDVNRSSGISKTLSEVYCLAKDRGSVAFVASTHFGIVNYLNILLYGLYNLMDGKDYGQSIGNIQKDALQNLVNVAPGDYFARLHAEEMTTHGDPALKLNQGPTDYDVESSTVTINPNFISVNNSSFSVKAKFYNLGRAVSDSVLVQVQRVYPDGSSTFLLKKKIPGIRYADSVQLTVPIVATRDKGDNKIVVSINPDNKIPEVTYANNSVTTDVFIYQDGATPVYPYNYSIINTPTSKLTASTANPLSLSAQYVMQLDTTQNFNSALKVEKVLTSSGGVLEFDPGISFMDSVVYYWRISVVPASGGTYTWNYSSFVYIDPARSSTGSNQSHYFQHLNSTSDSISLAGNRQWIFNNTQHTFFVSNAMFPAFSDDRDFEVGVDGNNYIQSACLGHSVMFNVFDPVTLRAWLNVDQNGNNLHLSGSADANCGTEGRYWNFEFSYMDPASRLLAMKFMDSIPAGYYVVVRSFDYDDVTNQSYSASWRADTSSYGSNKSLYHYLLNAGFTQIDSVSFPRDWQLIYKKGDPSFTPQFKLSHGIFDKISMDVPAINTFYSGTMNSPIFGPAKSWSEVHWKGHDPITPVTDTVGLQVVGLDTLGNHVVLYRMNRATTNLNISSVNAKLYPNIQLRLVTADTVHAKPYQLDYWRVNYTPTPEGALAANILFKSLDTVVQGQPLPFTIAFKNVSPYNFDSLRIKMYILDKSNVMHPITLPRRKPLVSGDTVTLNYTIDSKGYSGANTIYVGFNPDNDQPEQYLFNNFVYKSVYVKSDSRGPTLDVTFDNVHILNEDIVSARPHIQVKLQSQSGYLLLTDTSMIKVQVQYPDGSVHSYGFNTDTLRFTPASASGSNVATVDFTPAFTKQYNPEGDTYTLIVSGKDGLGNSAGATPYRVSFKVITKAMISNMLNYPNPFTTSTAFVFTVTGTDVPQNIKIQILTITGKIVREITKEELGPLHVGRNITEFKWNGTDMYGQRLANGVYLYHVVTNLNSQSLSKYKASGDNTDKYFNNGYGKMYLMK